MAKKKNKVEFTSDQIDRSLSNERLRLAIGAILATFIGAGLFALMATPLAKAIAGTDTNFNLNISIAVNVALALTTAAGGAGCIELNRRRRHHQKRAKQLEKRLGV